MSKEFIFHYHPKHTHPFCFIPVVPRTSINILRHFICDCCQTGGIGDGDGIEGMFICIECDFDLCMNCFYRPLRDREEQTEGKLEFSVHLEEDGKTYEEVLEQATENDEDVELDSPPNEDRDDNRDGGAPPNEDRDDNRDGGAPPNEDRDNNGDGGAPPNEDILDEDQRD